MTWQDQARCQGTPIGVFYADGHYVTARAQKLCESCPVSEECLEYALENEDYGTWAGTTPIERKKIRQQRKIELRRTVDPRIPTVPNHDNCGTNAGYVTVLRIIKKFPYDNYKNCDECVSAHNEYTAIKTAERLLYVAHSRAKNQTQSREDVDLLLFVHQK